MTKFIPSKNLKSILKKGEDHKTEFKEEVYKKLDREIVRTLILKMILIKKNYFLLWIELKSNIKGEAIFRY